MAYHNELGKKGEGLVVNYLKEKGYQILHCNYRYLKAEVDIIAKTNDTIVAVEVKTRTTNYFGDPKDFINQKKVQLLISAMDHFMQEYDLDNEVRFDIVSVIGNTKFEIEHIENAFLHF